MFRMLSCFDLEPEADFETFQAEYMEFVEDMRRLGLVESTGPIGQRRSDTPMDTDDERGHQYFVITNFCDRAQVDAAYDYIRGQREPGNAIHRSVYAKVVNPVFICWEDAAKPGQ